MWVSYEMSAWKRSGADSYWAYIEDYIINTLNLFCTESEKITMDDKYSRLENTKLRNTK